MTATSAWVTYLDEVARLDFMRTVKHQITDLLELHPGDTVLDAGCGTGDDAREMAMQLGQDGQVTGLDNDDEILVEARRRTEGTGLPVTFVRGDVQRLDFADDIFSRCRSERMFQHVPDHHTAMNELVRVLQPGGVIVVYDTDWETLIIDAQDWQTTRALLNVHCAEHRHGWIGRMLPGLMRASGLRDIQVVPTTLMFRDLALAERLHTLRRTADFAIAEGRVTTETVEAWFDDLRRRDAQERFFCSVTSFIVQGRKP
jgi:ubiquinone/menaquinone biosynthesis C-methylase UbiE